MNQLIRPFRGLRPTDGYASDVAAPPYDVMNAAEARKMVEGKPWSFLHISRPEVDLPEETDPYSPEVYAKAVENLQRMMQASVLQTDVSDSLYAYRMTLGEQSQTGVVAGASVDAYNSGRIKKHEFTQPKKEDDRVRQIDALNAQTGPVLLACPNDDELERLLAKITVGLAQQKVYAADGVLHEVWVISDSVVIERLVTIFEAMPALYIADGHHRSAAASRVAAKRQAGKPDHTGEELSNYFLSVIFPHNQMRILDYNRVIRDLNGHDADSLLPLVAEKFKLEPSDTPVRATDQAEFGMYLQRQWYRLKLDPRRIPQGEPVASLDISLLARELIEPLLGISDPRLDDRIDFVGGIRGLKALEQRVDSGEMAVAFTVRPTSMEALMAVADAGDVMPPKSTWFEPKLVDGLVSLTFG